MMQCAGAMAIQVMGTFTLRHAHVTVNLPPLSSS